MGDLGYSIIPNVLCSAEIDRLIGSMSGNADRTRAGARHLLKNPAIAALARDSRLIAIASSILGGTAQPFRATYFDKSRAANWLVTWHQDTALPLRQRSDNPVWGPWSVKAGVIYAHAPASALEQLIALRIHLDDSNADNGPLRVLAGSHALGVLTDEEISGLTRTVPSIDCVVARGGVIAMRPLIVHASSKSTSNAPRRVIHIEYAVSLAIDEDMELQVA